MILPQTNGEGAYKIADRIRQIIEQFEIVTEKGIVRVTISIGVSDFDCTDTNHGGSDIAVAQQLLNNPDVGICFPFVSVAWGSPANLYRHCINQYVIAYCKTMQLCLKSGPTNIWKCSECGHTLDQAMHPQTCPSCKKKCEFVDASCSTPDLGPDSGNVNPYSAKKTKK